MSTKRRRPARTGVAQRPKNQGPVEPDSGSPAQAPETESAAGEDSGIPHRTLILGLAVFSLVLILMQSWGATRLVSYPLEANFGEGVILAEGSNLREGIPLYRDINEPPYWSATYPPLGHGMLALGSRYESHGNRPHPFVVQPDPGAPDFVQRPASSSLSRARTLSFGFMAVSGFLLTGLVIGSLRSPRTLPSVGQVGLGLVAVACWMTSPFVGEWLAVARIDSAGRILCAGSTVLACLALTFHRRNRPLVLQTGLFLGAAVLAALAAFTKQSLLAAGLVACGAPLLLGRTRLAVGTTGLYGFLVLVLYGILHISTGGWSTQNLTGGTARGLDFSLGWAWWSGFLTTHAPLLGAALLGWGVWSRILEGRLLAVALVAGIPHALLAANSGSDRNYFFDILWPLCALGALAGWQKGWAGRIALALLGLQLVLTVVLAPTRWPTAAETAAARDLIQRYLPGPNPEPADRGRILSEYPQWNLVAYQRPEFLPYLTAALESDGRFRSGPLADLVRQRVFRVVLTTPLAPSRFPRAVLESLQDHYYPAEQVTGLYFTDFGPGTPVTIWKPNPGPSGTN